MSVAYVALQRAAQRSGHGDPRSAGADETISAVLDAVVLSGTMSHADFASGLAVYRIDLTDIFGLTFSSPHILIDRETVGDLAKIDMWVALYLWFTSTPNCAVSVGSPDGRLVHAAGYTLMETCTELHACAGYPGYPLFITNRRTPFRMASISKVFTAVTILTQVQDGLISLDDGMYDVVRTAEGWPREVERWIPVPAPDSRAPMLPEIRDLNLISMMVIVQVCSGL